VVLNYHAIDADKASYTIRHWIIKNITVITEVNNIREISLVDD